MPGLPVRVRRRPPPGGAGHEIEVLEKDTDTSWATFQALQRQQERSFERTLPATLVHVDALQSPPAGLSIDDVLLEARRDNRVCPKPLIWKQLYDYLPNKVQRLPSVPTTRSEWERMSALEKRSRLRLHIEWAAAQGVLRHVYKALQSLPEDRWHHMGE